MKFSEAKKELEILARGEHHSLLYSLTDKGVNIKEIPRFDIECTVYVHGYGLFKGQTWHEALAKIRDAITPKSFDPSEAPESDAIFSNV
jgi:hypothetical protein